MGFDFDTKDTVIPLLILKLSKQSEGIKQNTEVGKEELYLVSVLPISFTPSLLLESRSFGLSGFGKRLILFLPAAL